MARNTFGSNVGETEEEMIAVEPVVEPVVTEAKVKVPKERELECVYVGNGVYKYIYADTKEDVV